MEPVHEQTQLYNKTYFDALHKNQEETARWTAYKQEHVDLKANLRMYQKAPRADIMIPIGSKALLPGQLYHTGEVMVSHGCGYFSECSAEQAQSIADRRIRLAEELLAKYEREREMYSDKLEVPLTSEAFAGAEGGREIIEEYDEETEKRWREEHRLRVRESKQREAKERAAKRDTAEETSDKELFAKLEEMELLEELEQEMDQLDLPTGGDGDGDDDDDQLGRLMRGEIRLNEHFQKLAAGTETVRNDQQRQPKENDTPTPVEEVVEVEEEIETTDDEEGSEERGDDEEEDDISAEFAQLLLETKNHSQKEKLKVFKAKLNDVRQRLYQNSIDLVQKVDLYQLHDELEEALDFLLSTDEPEKEERKAETPSEPAKKSSKEKGRKIQFAEQDQIKLIDNRHQEKQADEQEMLHNNSKNTLFLPIVHSNACYESPTTDEIVSPADIYRSFLAESIKQSPTEELKSILKNPKTTYHHNAPPPERPSVAKQPARRPGNESKESVAALEDVVGEIVEHRTVVGGTDEFDVQQAAVQQQQEQQPKKKVSRFKQTRK
ncbi:unconventional prefoldin RPB5 interactor-like protein isoform X2 [Anopheles arabiensis]|uniref:unconventional prefoldin RPB5 interactor-like protein isoform X2 n=1 Tax=Anopheles arabiensis TaxID=7173 RepID=UPI001AAC9726|nr:unconventional prefoldin RPB5 interactor-like protein isoform X2 [Anopheles arabiensis]